MTALTKQDQLTELLEPTIQRLGFDLLGMELVASQNSALLRLYIEHPQRPIGIDDCELVSREVSALLDVNDPIQSNFRLEVSSPGVDRPLFKPAHYQRFVGQEIKLETVLPVSGRRRFKGRLLAADQEAIDMEQDKQRVRLQYHDIGKAKLVPDYAELLREANKQPAPGGKS